MILHYHYSDKEYSGEIRRIKNIDSAFGKGFHESIIEVAFVSIQSVWRKNKRFHLSDFVSHKIRVPEVPFSNSIYICKLLNSYWTSLVTLIISILFRPKFIIGEYTIARQSLRFNPLKIPFILDCHGDNVSEYTFRNKDIDKRTLSFLEKMEKKSVECAKYVVCQSEAMKNYLMNKHKQYSKNKFFVFRCSADLSFFNLDDECRKKSRKELGISDKTLLFVYSGGLHRWQKIEESLAWFERYNQDININSKFLIMTLDADAAHQIVKNDFPKIEKNVIIKTVSYSDVAYYLNGADVAFLIRENIQLNIVAYPTKLAEYMACGLPVISRSVAYNWIDKKEYIFNIDNQCPENLATYLSSINKSEISAYAKKELSLRKDMDNISALIVDARKR